MNENPFKLLPADLVITSKTFGLLRNVLIEHVGLEKAKRFLLRFGRELGIEKAIDILLIERNIEDSLKVALELHVSLGHISNITATGRAFKKDTGSYFDDVHGVWHDSFEVPIQLNHFGKASECSCYILSGFASGILTTFYNEEIFVKEVTCRARGDENCTFIVNTKEYWETKDKESLDIYDNQTIIDELEYTYDKLLQQKNLLKKVTEFHSKITETIAQQNDINKVLQAVFSSLQIPVFITDLEGNILFKEGIAPDSELSLTQIIKKIRTINRTTVLNNGFYNFLVAPIKLDFKNFAFCFFIYDKNTPPDTNDHLFLERLGVAASLCFLNEKVSFEATERLKINFLDRLINHHFQNSTEIVLHSKYITPKLKPPYRTISMKLVINNTENLFPDRYQIILEIAKFLKLYHISGLLSQKNEHIILFLYDFTDYNWALKSLNKICHEIEKGNPGLTFKNGISNEFEVLESFYTCLTQAEQAMNFPRNNTFTEYHTLGFYSALLENFNAETLITIGQNELGPLLVDVEKNYELLHTLYIFLKNSQKLEKTMQDLSLSIGGIKYRISKIEKMLNIDLKDATTSAHILLLIEVLLLLDVIVFK